MNTEKITKSFESLISSESFDLQKYQELKAELDKVTTALENKKLQYDWIENLSRLDPELHQKITRYCKMMKENPYNFVNTTLNQILDEFNQPAFEKTDYKSYEDYVNDESKKILKKYIDEYKDKDLVKSEQYIMSEEVEFVGHSVIDAKPIYNIKSELKDKSEDKIQASKVKSNEIGRKIIGDENREVHFEIRNTKLKAQK